MRRAVRPPKHTLPPPRGDAGASEIVGALMLTLISFVMLASFSDVLFDAQPKPLTSTPIDVGFALDAGEGQWGDGDESVKVVHQGGESLARASTTIGVSIGGTTWSFADGALTGPFADGVFTVGETWSSLFNVPANSQVHVVVTTARDHGEVVGQGRLVAGPEDCAGDVDPPTVYSWTTSPSDLDTDTSTAFTVTVDLRDLCAGLASTPAPHLHWRLNDGGDPAYTDQGALTQLSATVWQGSIPEPGTGWEDHENDTLELYIDPLTDLNGNAGASVVRSDKVQPATPVVTETYVATNTPYNGTVAQFGNARSAVDAGAEATLTEGSQGTGPSTSEIYATAHTSNGAIDPGRVTGSPDDGHATVPTGNDWVGASGFDVFTGNILSVELGYDAYASGTTSGTADDVVFSYEVGGAAGASSSTVAVTELPAEAGSNVSFVNITADRAWQWSDISNLKALATYQKNQGEDAAEAFVDALWLRVRHDAGGYNLSVRMDVTGVPAGTTQDLQIRYRVTDDTFLVDVWNFTSGAWVQRGATLDQTTATSWVVTLTADEVQGGDVRLRLRDSTGGGSVQGQLHLDYVRVRTS